MGDRHGAVEDVEPMDLTMETIARAVVVVTSVSLLLVGVAVLIRERTQSRPAPLERDTGLLALVNYAGILLFVFVGLAAAITNGTSWLGLGEPFEAAVRLAGVVVLWAAGLLAVWGIRAMGRNMASEAEVRPDTELVTSGPFGLVRHPLYLSILLLWTGGALALLSWALAIGAIVLAPAFYARSRAEERLLTRHFGAAYTAYAARVPMLVPWFRGR